MALWPFILVKNTQLKNDRVLINHELIHLRQQLELAVVVFYIWYIIEYLMLRFNNNHYQAYHKISFEKEAYIQERDFHYLSDRPWFQFLKYYSR